MENNIPPTRPEQLEMGRYISWMKVLVHEEGTFPDLEARFIPRPCMHCDNPPCVNVCPVQATYRSEETGIIGQIYPRCIGCRYCANACPYAVKDFNWYEPEWPEGLRRQLNPDVSVRTKGVIEKCTFCHHRLQRARDRARLEGRSLREGDYQPACADICPTRAITFGDLDNSSHRIHELSLDPRAMKLMEGLGTGPKVIYLSEAE
jgi:molybdopterin-containing oxidoreductase family iron-sulfur binding subunit